MYNRIYGNVVSQSNPQGVGTDWREGWKAQSRDYDICRTCSACEESILGSSEGPTTEEESRYQGEVEIVVQGVGVPARARA